MWESLGLTKIIVALITAFLGPFFLWWLKEKYENNIEENKRTLNEEVRFAQNVSEELEEIRESVGADRVWIAQFHNGGKFLNSIRDASMKRMSITHEVTGAGISKEQNTFSDMLVTFFSNMVNRILDHDHVEYRSKEHTGNDPEAELLFRQRGTEEMHIMAMRNIDDTLIGIMGVDFVEESSSVSEKEIQYLIVKANLIAGYIFYGKVMQNSNSD